MSNTTTSVRITFENVLDVLSLGDEIIIHSIDGRRYAGKGPVVRLGVGSLGEIEVSVPGFSFGLSKPGTRHARAFSAQIEVVR